KDVEAECLAYERKIQGAGGIDLQVLGIGADGHIAFCEPGSSLAGRTGPVALHPRTIADNARFFADPGEVPRRALSMGVGTILEAKVCLILASGQKKASIWAAAVEGSVTSQVTASALQLHPFTIALCDEPAASELRNRDYYRHVQRETGDEGLLPASLFEGT
ncbi:MAG: 6-phosphogluconolactonase, partial [Planctomycetia bacterium]|nr:6-phosphogluconolactonase [Planctomycetia bacterium]